MTQSRLMMDKSGELVRTAFSINQKTPSILQALVSIAAGLGIPIEVSHLVRLIGTKGQRVTSSDLIRCARSVGLRVTGVRPGWRGLVGLAKNLPAIVMLDSGDAMIISTIKVDASGQRVTLQDPQANDLAVISLDRRQFSRIWSGEVILIRRTNSAKAGIQPFTLHSIVHLILRERSMLRDIAISALALSFLALLPIFFMRIATDRVLPYKAISTFTVLCTIALILVVFEGTFSATRRYLLSNLTTRVDIKITTDMFERVLKLPIDYFEQTPAGLTLHKMSQINRIRNFLVGQLFGTLLDSGVLLFFMPVMFFINPTLTTIVLCIAVLICIWIVVMLPLYKKKSGEVEKAESERGIFLSQSIQGVRTVKSLAMEERQVQDWDTLTARIARAKFEESYISNIIQTVVSILERLMTIGSFGVGVYLALTNDDPGYTSSLFTFLLLSQRLGAPIIQAAQLINQYDEARNAVGIVGSLINQPPEEGPLVEGVRNELRGQIDFSSVLFQYKAARKPALKNVTFEIPQGTTLGVMGRSGSGKTTITRLLQRLASDYSGSIKIDGIDIRNYDISHYRSSLGVVLQENFLFSGTIRSNIMIAKPDATFEQVVNAARLAGAEEFIDKLPAGYETNIYEGSPNLSGGQRQRLAIARALITDPKILILDEATSALDAESEAIVNANIERISQGRTVITISHRLASLVKADAILVMEQGEVNDIGKHHELLERNEIYANLWYTQNPHTAAPAAPRPQLTYRGPQSVA